METAPDVKALRDPSAELHLTLPMLSRVLHIFDIAQLLKFSLHTQNWSIAWLPLHRVGSDVQSLTSPWTLTPPRSGTCIFLPLSIPES